MKKKLTLAALLALVLGLWTLQGPAAQAACGQNGSAQGSAPNETATDPVGPSNTRVYSADTSNGGEPNGYIGVKGDTGYAEADGGNDSLVEGQTTNGAVEGRVTTAPSVCVNNTTAP